MGNDMKEKSLPLAIGLNLLLPGVGYMYMGKVLVGIAALLLILLILVSTPLLVILPVWLGLNLIMAIDMYMLHSKRKKEIVEHTTKKCPNCAEMIQKEAKLCRFCGTKFET